MIYEMRVYTLQPGGLSPWLKLYEEKALPVFATIEGMKLVGYFRAETGVLNRVVHIWSYPDPAARDAAHRAIGAHPHWVEEFAAPARQYLVAQETTLLSAVPFSPMQ
jgi:hypothetical protein